MPTNGEWKPVPGEGRADAEAARTIVPAALRPQATVVGLNQRSLEVIDDILKRHSAGAS